jgi:hypothetical protein
MKAPGNYNTELRQSPFQNTDHDNSCSKARITGSWEEVGFWGWEGTSHTGRKEPSKYLAPPTIPLQFYTGHQSRFF